VLGDEEIGAIFGQATGIHAGFFDGTITNAATGVISAAVDASAFASALGVHIESGEGGVQGALNNSGTISATADGGEGAVAVGILSDSLGESGSILNSGDVSASATAFFDARATGIGVDGGMIGAASITNALGGTIGGIRERQQRDRVWHRHRILRRPRRDPHECR